MSKKNFQITAKEDGKKYWISPSVAVSAITILRENDKDVAVLISKRGPGCPDEIGKWSFTCGYLDHEETLESAVKRELFEEIGLRCDKLKHCEIKQWKAVENIKPGYKGNVTVRYKVYLDLGEVKDLLERGVLNTNTEKRGGEPDEVSDIMILRLKEHTSPKKWAFNHYDIYKEL